MLPPILLPPSALAKHNPYLKISYFRHWGHTDKNNWGLGEWTSEYCTQLMHTHERSLTRTLDIRKLYTTNASTWKVSNQSLEQRLCLGEQFIRSAENWDLQLTAVFLKTQNVARGYLFKGGLSTGGGQVRELGAANITHVLLHSPPLFLVKGNLMCVFQQ